MKFLLINMKGQSRSHSYRNMLARRITFRIDERDERVWGRRMMADADESPRVLTMVGSQKRPREEPVLQEKCQRTQDHCTHEVVLPPGAPPGTGLPLPTELNAVQFPFQLDEFQKIAVGAVERGDSVMVAAHTSAGKTVVAQYAIAMSLARGQRVVYTSPIKALSNQKYRELTSQFGNEQVGLMTGDCNVNVDASCLVMTTEILRNMLYRGSEIIREIKWVIFDEVHYMRDKERGVIWEECIVLLPSAVRFVFLSATVPNGREFAAWVAATHGLPCHLVTTPHRPTPLQHWVYPVGGDGLHLLVDESGRFRDAAFDAVCATFETTDLEEQRAHAARLGSRHSPELLRLLRMLVARDLTPAIVFAFSRKECEGAARSAQRIDPLPDEQRDAVRAVFEAAISTLSSDDQAIRQVGMLLPLLERGVAVHHSGMLPVLREVVEILFQENLVRLLFATETFAMGVNMPARTVVFTSIRKWDGETFRPPHAAEYIQMSGRAGRRGLDARGMVVLMLPEQMEREALRAMMGGAPLELTSSFRLRYNTLLRLYGMESLQPDVLVRRSFWAFQRAHAVPELHSRRHALLAEAAALTQPDDAQLEQLALLRETRRALEERVMEVALQPKHALRFLQPGRLVRVVERLDERLDARAATQGGEGGADGGGLGGAACEREGGVGAVVGAIPCELDRGWGVVVGFRHLNNRLITDELVAASSRQDFVVDVLLPCAPGAAALAASGDVPKPAKLSDSSAEAHVLPVRFDMVRRLSAARLWLPVDLRSSHAREVCLEAMRQLLCLPSRLGSHSRSKHACLHPTLHLGAECSELVREIEAAGARERALRRALGGGEEDEEEEVEGDLQLDASGALIDDEGGAAAAADAGAGDMNGQAASIGDDQEKGELEKGELEVDRASSGTVTGTGALPAAEAAEKPHSPPSPPSAPSALRSRLARLETKRGVLRCADACALEAELHATDDFGEQMRKMKSVLRRLGHLDDENVVQLKGRAAAELEACDELLASELILAGTFNDLSPAAAVALCAPLIAPDHEKVKRVTPPHADLAPGYRALQEAARTLAGVLNDAGFPTVEAEFVAKFEGGLLNVVFAWAKGAKFSELCDMCDLFEGSIIRCIRRISELLDEMQSAAKAIGNEELYRKFNEGAKLIRRDIVFAGSLYLEA